MRLRPGPDLSYPLEHRFQLFDRALLMLYYKLLRKKIASPPTTWLRAEDATDSLLNRLTEIQYQLADLIFVHTNDETGAPRDFDVRERAVTVVHIGVNNSVPDTVCSTLRNVGWASGTATGRSCSSVTSDLTRASNS